MEEYRLSLGASERMSHQRYPFLLRGSPYAERYNVLGLPKIIENAPPDALTGFFQKWYRADNMALVFVGDFVGAALEASLKSHFLIPAPDAPLNRPRYDLPPPKKGSFDALILTDPELTGSSVSLYYKQKPRAPRYDIASFREMIINRIAGIMLSYRFDEERFKPSTPYINAGAGYESYGYSSAFYTLWASAKLQSTEAALRKLFEVKEQLARYGFTAAEKKLARDSLLSSWEQGAAEKDRQHSSGYVGMFSAHFLNGGGYLSDDGWDLEALKALLPGISLKEINQAVKKRFDEDDLMVIILAPESEKNSLPQLEQIKAMVSEYRKAKIQRPQPSAGSGKLINGLPVPGNIISETVDSDAVALRWKLSNGAEVILKETKNKDNSISFYALARGGILSFPPEMDISSSFAGEMLAVSGLGPHSRSELNKLIADKVVSFSFGAGNSTRSFGGSAAATDIATLFEIIHLWFTQPRFDAEAVEVMLNTVKTNLIRQAEDPPAFFSREISRVLSGNSRFHPIEIEQLDKVNLDKAMQFILACSNPSDYTFVFVGNINIDVMRSLSETYLASIPPRPESFNEWNNVDYMRPRSVVKKDVRKGMEKKSSVYLAWFTPDTYTQEADAVTGVLSEYLRIVLLDELREELGGVYGVSSGVSISMIPHGELSGSVSFGCDPQRAEQLAAAVETRLKAIAQGSIDRDAFTKAVEALLKGEEESLQNNSTFCYSYANSAVLYRSPLSRLDRWPALYTAVTAADIQRTMTRLLSGGGVKMILYPED
jgi:zinc protease